MNYRTGTYVAFDGLGESDPSKSDYRYYATLQAWSQNDNIDFRLVNSHEKTSAVRDDSLRRTLYARIDERLRMSKQMVVIVSSDTRSTGSVLSYEIKRAVDAYQIPLIIAYPDQGAITGDSSLWFVRRWWPDALEKRIADKSGYFLHVPFKKEPLRAAMSYATVQRVEGQTGSFFYNADCYRSWGVQ